MSSELVKKLELAKLKYADDLVKVAAEDFCEGFMEGIQAATNVVKEHEKQQMKEPFYPLDEEQLKHLQRLKDMVVLAKIPINKVFPMLYKLPIDKNNNLLLIHAFTQWAIEQEKLEEEK